MTKMRIASITGLVPATLLLFVACAAPPVPTVVPPPTATVVNNNFAGLVDIGDGRRLYLECNGSGAPTVILEAGLRNRGDVWSTLPEPNSTQTMSMQGIAQFTRVCAYDRPGTTLGLDLFSRSDAAPMPRTVQDTVNDLHALLLAANIPGPYVMVGHSTGGMIVRLYATEYPQHVVGMVWVDALPEDMASHMSPENFKTFIELNTAHLKEFEAYQEFETIELDKSFAQMRAAKPLSAMPLFVLSRGVPTTDFPGSVPPAFGPEFESAWQTEQKRLVTLEPNAKHAIAQQSGHYIQVQQADLVIGAVRQVVEAVRDPGSWR